MPQPDRCNVLDALQVTADLPEAFAVLGFAFYVQPMLMPLLHEMPAGPLGVRVMSTAVRWVVIVIASSVSRPAPPGLLVCGRVGLVCAECVGCWQQSTGSFLYRLRLEPRFRLPSQLAKMWQWLSPDDDLVA